MKQSKCEKCTDSAATYVAGSGRDISAQTVMGATKHTDSCGVAKH